MLKPSSRAGLSWWKETMFEEDSLISAIFRISKIFTIFKIFILFSQFIIMLEGDNFIFTI